jgi:hypothetical protein
VRKSKNRVEIDEQCVKIHEIFMFSEKRSISAQSRRFKGAEAVSGRCFSLDRNDGKILDW